MLLNAVDPASAIYYVKCALYACSSIPGTIFFYISFSICFGLKKMNTKIRNTERTSTDYIELINIILFNIKGICTWSRLEEVRVFDF